MKQALVTITAILMAGSLYAADAPPPAKAETAAKPFIYIQKPYDVMIGKPSAPVTIVEYASLSCPHCAHFYNEILPVINKKYIETGKVRLVYRDYPLNNPAIKAAEVVQCVEKERRHEFLSVLFKMQVQWAFTASYLDALSNIAALGGLEKAKFDKCINDPTMENNIIAVEKEASDEYKVNSTPSFFINGTAYKGYHDVENMSKAIEDALASPAKK